MVAARRRRLIALLSALIRFVYLEVRAKRPEDS